MYFVVAPSARAADLPPGTGHAQTPHDGVRGGAEQGAQARCGLVEEEYEKLRRAGDRDVHDRSQTTTLPVGRAVVAAYVRAGVKPPWYIDLLNLNLGNHDLATARARVAAYLAPFERDRPRLTENLQFARPAALEQSAAAVRDVVGVLHA